MRIRPLVLAVALLVAAVSVSAAPAPARADADPPSDVLILQDVYYPFTPRVSLSLVRTLDKVVARAKKAGYPIRVAIVATRTDLGAVPHLFNKPKEYAPFLGGEIDFKSKRPLLALMPVGFATHNVSAAAAKSIDGVKIEGDQVADAMARAAIEAVPKLATASGSPVAAVKIPAASGGGSRGGAGGTEAPILLIVGGPIALVALAALGAALVRRRRGDEDEDLDEGQA